MKTDQSAVAERFHPLMCLQDIATRYRIRSMPTFKVFKNGSVVGTNYFHLSDRVNIPLNENDSFVTCYLRMCICVRACSFDKSTARAKYYGCKASNGT